MWGHVDELFRCRAVSEPLDKSCFPLRITCFKVALSVEISGVRQSINAD
jgi:hypothetical protein